MLLRRLESTILQLGDGVGVRICSSGNLGLRFLWLTVHLILSIWYFVWGLVNGLESFIISSGLSKKYKDLNIHKVKYLAVVIDSEEARQTLKVLNLLRWLDAMGLKNVCLYDAEGVLKESKEALTFWLKSEKSSKEMATSEPLLEQKHMSLEVISFADAKNAVAEAANFLLKKHYLNANNEKPNLTELDMTDALGAIGYEVSEPDLMLIFGPARCHLGFPAWRIRYTEIVHMGPLKSTKFGALIKAIHKFTMVHQNFGT